MLHNSNNYYLGEVQCLPVDIIQLGADFKFLFLNEKILYFTYHTFFQIFFYNPSILFHLHLCNASWESCVNRLTAFNKLYLFPS